MTVEPPGGCVRCGGRLIRNHDELECLVHGLQWSPRRAYDPSGSVDAADRAELKARGIIVGKRGATVTIKPAPLWQFEGDD